jgi:hypothetical protein
VPFVPFELPRFVQQVPRSQQLSVVVVRDTLVASLLPVLVPLVSIELDCAAPV